MKQFLLFGVMILVALITRSQTIYVNEIMFKPGPGSTGCDQKLLDPDVLACGREYIELYNSDCNNDFDLSGFILASANSTGSLGNAGAICFPPGTIVPAGDFLIIGGGNDNNPSANGSYDYPAGSFDFKIPSYSGTQYTCLNTPGEYWFLSNFDGWMALFEPDGTPHYAVYWSSNAGNINSVSDFNVIPCTPAAAGAVTLKSARQLYNLGAIEYIGNPGSVTIGNTFSRLPDGGTMQANRPKTIGPLRSDRCNDGNCLACGNLLLQPQNATCEQNNGQITATVVNPITSPGPYTFELLQGTTVLQTVPGVVDTFHIFTGLNDGVYTVKVTDSWAQITEKTTTLVSSDIVSVTAVPTTCDPTDNTYDVTVTVTFTNPPSAGTLTISCNGNDHIVNPPFTSPFVYVFTNFTSDGANETASTAFSETGCNKNTNFVAPDPCLNTGCSVVASANPDGVCPGESTDIHAAGIIDGATTLTYSWTSSPAGFTATGTDHTVTPASTTQYIVTISDGAGTSCSSQVMVTVHPAPSADFSMTPNPASPGDLVTFPAYSSGADGFFWDFGDGYTGNSAPEFTHTFNDEGMYMVTLIATNAYGCSDTVSQSMLVSSLFFPNVITPNGDGFNDVLEIRNAESYINNRLIVYNRWGKNVYEQSPYLNNWNGDNLSDGTYYYLFYYNEKCVQSTLFINRN